MKPRRAYTSISRRSTPIRRIYPNTLMGKLKTFFGWGTTMPRWVRDSKDYSIRSPDRTEELENILAIIDSEEAQFNGTLGRKAARDLIVFKYDYPDKVDFAEKTILHQLFILNTPAYVFEQYQQVSRNYFVDHTVMDFHGNLPIHYIRDVEILQLVLEDAKRIALESPYFSFLQNLLEVKNKYGKTLYQLVVDEDTMLGHSNRKIRELRKYLEERERGFFGRRINIINSILITKLLPFPMAFCYFETNKGVVCI